MDAVGFGIAPRALRLIWCGGICPACRWNRPRVQGRRQSRGCRAGAGLPKGTVEVQRKMPGTGPAWALAHVCLKDMRRTAFSSPGTAPRQGVASRFEGDCDAGHRRYPAKDAFSAGGGQFLWLCSSLRLIKRKALLSFMVVLSPQCGENTAFFSSFPLGWIH